MAALRLALLAPCLLVACLPMVAAGPIEAWAGEETTVAETCRADPGVLGWGVDVYYQPIYFTTSDPHVDGMVLTAGAHGHEC